MPSDQDTSGLQQMEGLKALELLGIEGEPVFDDVVAIASSLLQVPMAMLTFTHDGQVWCKAGVGLDQACFPITGTIWAGSTVEPTAACVVPDLERDARVSVRALSKHFPAAKSYLGAPVLDADDVVVATLGVMDTRARDWTAAEVDQVRRLSLLVSGILNERRDRLKAAHLVRENERLSSRLKRKQELIQDMAQVGRIGGWEIELETGEISWSEETRKIFEVAASFIPTPTSVLQFYNPADQKLVRSAVRACVETGESLSTEMSVRTASGRRIQIRSHCALQRSESGNPARLLGTVQDITIEHQNQAQLTAALRKADRALSDVSAYQAALDKHAIVAITDARGRITFVNDKFCEISGYPREELIGANHRILNSGNHPTDFFKDLWRTIAKGKPWQGEICNRAKNGQLYWVDTTIVPMLGPNGRPDRYVSVRYDITARKATDAALAEALQKANEATFAKSAFVANMSHEIRTPLNGVIAMAGALACTDLNQRQQEMVALLQSSGETLERLLSDILDLSRIEAGKLTIDHQPFDLRQAVVGATDLMRLRADNNGLVFDVSFYGPVDGQFMGDAVRIRQIISNLTSNAIKFTANGRVAVAVGIEEHGDGQCILEIKVEDTGIGFDKTVREQLFSRFEQADSSITRRFGGSGLGLAICRSLCDMMGGTIDATSQPGVGSTFVVCLPLVRSGHGIVELPGSGGLDLTKHDAAEDSTSPVSILLVEDHPMNQRIVQIILEPLGFTVTVASDGLEGIATYQQSHFDLILMDMQMPNMDGLAATRAIRQLEVESGRARTPIAMLSANAMLEHRLAALEAGCDSHIAKPVTPDSLRAGIEELLASQQAVALSGETVPAGLSITG